VAGGEQVESCHAVVAQPALHSVQSC
jgi:hypothetical protein